MTNEFGTIHAFRKAARVRIAELEGCKQHSDSLFALAAELGQSEVSSQSPTAYIRERIALLESFVLPLMDGDEITQEALDHWKAEYLNAIKHVEGTLEREKRIADLEAELDKCQEVLEFVDDAVDPNTDPPCGGMEAVRKKIQVVLAPANPPAVEPKPDPIKEVYERFRHLDAVICDTDDTASWTSQALCAIWLAIKAHVEQGGKESQG